MADQGKHQLEKVVGQTIAKRRQSLGISQFELAERLNIAPASLSRIENDFLILHHGIAYRVG